MKKEMNEGFEAVENIKKGEFVKRKENANKTYTKGDFDRTYGYMLEDYDDISRCIYVKKGTKLFIGFTFQKEMEMETIKAVKVNEIEKVDCAVGTFGLFNNTGPCFCYVATENEAEWFLNSRATRDFLSYRKVVGIDKFDRVIFGTEIY